MRHKRHKKSKWLKYIPKENIEIIEKAYAELVERKNMDNGFCVVMTEEEIRAVLYNWDVVIADDMLLYARSENYPWCDKGHYCLQPEDFFETEKRKEKFIEAIKKLKEIFEEALRVRDEPGSYYVELMLFNEYTLRLIEHMLNELWQKGPTCKSWPELYGLWKKTAKAIGKKIPEPRWQRFAAGIGTQG